MAERGDGSIYKEKRKHQDKCAKVTVRSSPRGPDSGRVFCPTGPSLFSWSKPFLPGRTLNLAWILEDRIGLDKRPPPPSINTLQHVSLRGLSFAFSLKNLRAEACSPGRHYPPWNSRPAASPPPPPRPAPPSTAARTPASAPDMSARRCGRWTWRERP